MALRFARPLSFCTFILVTRSNNVIITILALMPEKFLIPHRDQIYVVDYSSILFFKSDDCYSHIHLNDGREFVLVTSLVKLEKEINHQRFIRISQSFLVNGDFITSIDRKKKFLLIGDRYNLPFTIPIKKLVELMVT